MIVAGNSIYERCGDCGQLVKNKSFFGTLHVCDAPQERQRNICTPEQQNNMTDALMSVIMALDDKKMTDKEKLEYIESAVQVCFSWREKQKKLNEEFETKEQE